MRKIPVVISYVVREDDGLNLVAEFYDSLRKFPPSSRVILVVSVKNANSNFMKAVIEIFENKIQNLKVLVEQKPDIGFDIGSHYLVGESYPGHVLIFMSASSRFNHPNWLKYLTEPFCQDSVGAVGTMLSLESIKDSYIELVDARLKAKLGFKMSQINTTTCIARGIQIPQKQINIGRIGDWIENRCLNVVCKVLENRNPLKYASRFPSFPNPHLRTTGFAVRADLMRIVVDKMPKEKYEAYLYESGYSSISRRVALVGFSVLHCDANGKYENYDEVSSPSTFRVKNFKSIVNDREARNFKQLPKEVQLALSRLTFGMRN